MAIKDGLINELKNEAAVTRKVLERIPAEKFDWQPHEKSMKMGVLAAHVADMFGWFQTDNRSGRTRFCQRFRTAETGEYRRVSGDFR